MSDKRIQRVAVGFALLMHLGFLGAVWGVKSVDKGPQVGPELVSIEAGLAVRKKSQQGKKKSNLPQKPVDQKAKAPDGITLTRDQTQAPPDPAKPQKSDEPPPPEMIDPNATFDKFRNRDTPATSETMGTGDSTEETAGADDGSEWGTTDDARGDPYLAELVGRLQTNPPVSVPSIVPSDSGLLARVCVRLSDDGRIVLREMPDDMKSTNSTFNRAVAERARTATDMTAPVPDHLKELLVRKGICIGYKY